MIERPGPCIEKKCSWCCDPVKVEASFPDNKIPVNDKGEKLWIDRKEIIAPESNPDHIRIKTFNCINHDQENNRCNDYPNRPEICRRTSCVSEESGQDEEEQHQRHISEKFINLNENI